MAVVTYSELRRKLKAHMDRVCDGHAPLLVMRKNGEHVVLLSIADYAELDETAYLMLSPANREHLLRSIAAAEAGALEEHDLLE